MFLKVESEKINVTAAKKLAQRNESFAKSIEQLLSSFLQEKR